MPSTKQLCRVVAALAALALGAGLAGAGLAGCATDELGDVREVRIGTHVEDWRDEVIYQALTDRFANGDFRTDYRVDTRALARYQGGDYQGMIDRLDYLERLGVTAIWISPIILNVDTDSGVDAYHGYWAVDFERLNPHFGDLATLRRLVNECHARGMKVVLDIVTNHVGQVFYYDINNNGRPDESVIGSGTASPLTRTSEYDPDYDPRTIQAFTSLGEAGDAPIRFFDMPDIFRIPPNPPIFQQARAYNRRGRTLNFDIEDQLLHGDFPGGLKDVNTELPEVREAMVNVYVRWALMTDLDGFRIDTIKHVDYGFWEYFAPEVRRRLAEAGKTNFLMFGEAFDGRDDLIGSFTRPGRLDSVFYFSQKFQVFDDVFMRGGPTRNIERLYNDRASNYSDIPQEGGIGVPPSQALVNFIDNHDVPRFLYNRNDPLGVPALRAALTYLLTEDGIPCIYYGTEQDYYGGNDPFNRERLWDSFYFEGETFQHIARLTSIRQRYRALRRGDFHITWVTDRVDEQRDAGIVSFERRTDEGEYALVVINAQGDHRSETRNPDADGGEAMSVTASAGTVLVDVLSGERHTVGGDGRLTIGVEGYAAAILVPESQYIAE